MTHERNHQTGRRLDLSTRFDVAMRGVLGIGSDLNALDDAELAEYAKWIAFYKRIRNAVQNGVCHRLQRLEVGRLGAEKANRACTFPARSRV